MKLLTVEYPQKYVCQVTVSATGETMETAAELAYQRTRPSYCIKGFLKGDADRAQIEADRGEHVFWYDAINDIIDTEFPAIFDQVIADEDLIVANDPSFDLVSVDKEAGFTATAQFCLLPDDLTVRDYVGIRVPATPSCVTEEHIQQYIERKQRIHAKLIPHKGPAVRGNTVHIDYLGTCNGEPFRGSEEKNATCVLGNQVRIPGIDEGIIGHSAGDEFEVPVTLPAHYSVREVAGKHVVFKVKLIDACVSELPALNCDFAKEVGNVDTMEEYHEVVRKTLEDLRLKNAMMNARTRVVMQLSILTSGDVPEPMIDDAFNVEMGQVHEMLNQQHMSKSQFLATMMKTEEEFNAELRVKAERKVRITLGLMKIGVQEELYPTEEEMQAKIAERATAEKITVEEMTARTNRKYLMQSMSRKKAADYIIEKSDIYVTEPAAPLVSPEKAKPASTGPAAKEEVKAAETKEEAKSE